MFLEIIFIDDFNNFDVGVHLSAFFTISIFFLIIFEDFNDSDVDVHLDGLPQTPVRRHNGGARRVRG